MPCDDCCITKGTKKYLLSQLDEEIVDHPLVDSINNMPECSAKTDKPKRKPTAWLNFSKSKCADGKFKEKGHEKYFDCVTAEASPAWKKMSVEEKAGWKTE